ncbi:DUF3311 domain-containing protein [Nocardioides acrostichi]|uniref:DUF3311 domain-containing protein n=1 Tax=Nocardioides acrostichi TaxID=2784339 RepID=A0A930UWQ1_9ACTN|nr:DUF3311 domain-containing protein [Nocardioides acrostichi]MBF4161067.1 DUF3311 domain-containing protein [Nocardioides acrostichi]
MTDSPSGDRSRPARPRVRRSGPWLLALLLLAPAVVVPLLVPIYDREGPTLWGFPFYFWFQFAFIIVAALLTTAAYRVTLLAERREREASASGKGGHR